MTPLNRLAMNLAMSFIWATAVAYVLGQRARPVFEACKPQLAQAFTQLSEQLAPLPAEQVLTPASVAPTEDPVAAPKQRRSRRKLPLVLNS
jgi:hypothetical protein